MRHRMTWALVAAVIAATVALERFFHDAAHVEFPWHAIPAFDFFFGLAGCALIVIGSKWLGHALLQRDESYYDEREDA